MSAPELNLSAAPKTISMDLWRGLTGASIALFALTMLWAFSGDARTIEGVPIWLKPAKFALSFVVLFATIALVVERLSPRVRNGWPLYLIGLGMGAAMIAEMGWIIRQAARGVGSHFNFATPFEELMYTTVMAAGAVYLVVAIGAIGWLAWRDRDANMSPALKEGVWLGFMASFILTLIVAGYMSGSNSAFVGTHLPTDPTVPFFGWSGVAGDLRPAHFLSLHAMQALPLLGLWLDRRVHGEATGSVRTIRIAAIVWTAATLGLFALALAGLPLIPMG